ncbi:DUF1707 SHOCT-like domain-containing protein [Actinomadura viridis]|uniref:DUF1707 domain-containing protein n=1 Tax=Actinomadura viridis TaxID=58110 RepID=A0A931DHC6_9ACTN|nr:DUF1707 domain-containing protein [Actinomadura viridis]MBG6087521.1 hypothetical protein [Actinomadura viridis]
MNAPRTEPAPRASDQDRDRVLVRLHIAYAEGRLDDRELDERIALVLASRTQDELDLLAGGLPALPDARAGRPETATADRSAERFPAAGKRGTGSTGLRRVPGTTTVVACKGDCVLDLREMETAGPVIALRVLAYRSNVRVLVPPGVPVEAAGLGVSTEIGRPGARSAPVVRLRGFAYKGAIEAMDHLRLP